MVYKVSIVFKNGKREVRKFLARDLLELYVQLFSLDKKEPILKLNGFAVDYSYFEESGRRTKHGKDNVLSMQ